MLINSHGDRDWRKYFMNDLVVKIDGVVATDVVSADDEAGFVVRLCRDGSGRVLKDGLKVATERREGSVEFIGTRRFSPEDARAVAEAKRARRRARNRRNESALNQKAGM